MAGLYSEKVNFFHRPEVVERVAAEAVRRGVIPSEVWREASERGLAAMETEVPPAQREVAA
jgi:hypothetical protein